MADTDPLARYEARRAAMRARIVEHLGAGVSFDDLNAVWIDEDVEIGSGAHIGRNVELRGQTVVASGAEVRAGCVLTNTQVGADAVIKPYSVCTSATIGPRAAVGPMAHLRPGSVLEADTKVGNFVETKKAVLRRGAKASHLSYIGDAEVGAEANIGAGTITCNYDGFGKHRTEIGEGAFIGSNTALVAPVSIGAGAIVGAGSVISREVPDDALAVERSTQKILEGHASRIRKRNAARAKEKK